MGAGCTGNIQEEKKGRKNNKMSELWMNIQAYFTSRLDEYLICLWQHISISILALLAAALIGIPCGYLCIR